MQHRRAPGIEHVAREVMEKHHALLNQRGPLVEWVMVKPEKPGGRVPDWKIRKVTGVNAYLALDRGERPDDWGFPVEALIAIEVSESYWLGLDAAQKEAMCDHVLAHMTYDYEKGTWSIEGPEFGEFDEVLERRGFWKPDRRLRRFAERVSEQLSLLPDEPDELEESEDEETPGQESLDVSITAGGRTVHTNTGTMRKLSERLAGEAGQADTVIVNGQVVSKETGEVLQESHA